jgi:cell division protein FtsW (lipid II flippase)
MLLLALLVVAAGFAMVVAGQGSSGASQAAARLVPLGYFAAAMLVCHLVVVVLPFRGDGALMASGLLLAGLGLLVQGRLNTLRLGSGSPWTAQAFPIGFGALLATLVLFGKRRAASLKAVALPCAAACVLIPAAMLAVGRRFRGGTFLEGNLNPSEIVKVLLVIFLAAFLTDRKAEMSRRGFLGMPALSPGGLLLLAFGLGAPLALLLLLRDLGMAVLLGGIFLMMATFATGRWGLLAAGGTTLAGLLAAAARAMPHAGARFRTWLDPFSDPTGQGWQVLQSLAALFTGGLWGSGLGAGHPQCVPIVSSDFVYAGFGEELGYAGCGLLLLLYLVFLHRGYRAADAQRDPFCHLLAAGLATMFAMQTLLNVGGVTKALPLTGITLPFLSHGGSSLVTSFVAFGLLLALSDGAAQGGASASRRRGGKRSRRKARLDGPAPTTS